MLFKKKAVQAEDVRPLMRCSFCGKSDKDVKKLVAGPNVFICDECIATCNAILEKDRRTTS